ncbi:sigma-70 family RNA polymerase sigma factor [Conexibacter woesei]|uniref:RNA polymerase, sigma-24 subunit, ECF subfamily n=1 Tax=Conexibacter woesei (strain DSM 14684 / CCUG 47730 / CIP 108061 / JCM 11494 / NBRC 100937 / ID131577) TaxID=469383 RepID=D3F2H4_CONWI|nr:sigma-70 family RNA polymerase sigma factor [Conexibacter woesei]ADB52240.1 RNA polymerase, sigma-24 subunit, ECF subfamily [Conexibacter woesei DSM 14684]
MDDHEWIAEQFEGQRRHLNAVAYRMLGSRSEADDAVQEAWLRASRAGADEVENLGGWLTTIVARVCLNMLRSRRTRHEVPLEEPEHVRVPDPLVSRAEGHDPEQAALLADSVGLALLVVLETLGPAERLAFVLHDLFGMPFDEIAPIVDRSPAATRQLASRARRRVRGAAPAPDPDLARQRVAVDAFFAAARDGDFDALVAVLDPDVVLRTDGGLTRGASVVVRGAEAVAGRARAYARISASVHPALVNGAAGVVVVASGRPFSIMGFTVADDRIVAIDALSDPARLAQLDLTAFGV